MRLPANKVRAAAAVVAVIAAVAVVIGVVVVVLGRDDRQSGCAEMTDAVGLYPGNNVTLLGVTVGTVSSVTRDGGHVRVQFSLDRSVRLPSDVVAVTTSDSIVTDRRLDFPRNWVSGPSWDMGTCIPMDRTRTPKSLSAALTAFDTLAKQINATGSTTPVPRTAVKQALADIDDQLKGTSAEFNSAVKGVSAALGDPRVRDDQLRSLVANVASLSGFFVQRWPDVQLALDNLQKFAISFRDLASELNPALVTVTRVTPDLIRLIKTYAPPVFSLLDPIVPLADTIPTDKIVAFLRSLPPVTSALNAMARQQQAGLSVTVTPSPVRFPGSPATCAVVNAAMPGTCAPSPGAPGKVDASVLGLALAGVGVR